MWTSKQTDEQEEPTEKEKLRFKTGSIIFGMFLLALDYGTKALVVAKMELYESIPLIPGFLQLTYIRNKGVAFGAFSRFDVPLLLSFISLFAVLFLVYLFIRTDAQKRTEVLALSVVISGALGNLIDRVQQKGVVDFIDFSLGSYHWPAFNVADSAITVGMFLFLLSFFLEERKKRGGNQV